MITTKPETSQEIQIPKKCPIPHKQLGRALSVLRRVADRVRGNSGVLNNNKEEEYVRYALLIKEFYGQYGEDLNTRLDWVYEQGMSREDYCMAIYRHITSLMGALSQGNI